MAGGAAMEAGLAAAGDAAADPSVRRDALLALISRVQRNAEGGQAEAELAVRVLAEPLPGAAATVRRHALWLLARAYPAAPSSPLPAPTADVLRAHLGSASSPRVRAVALRAAAWLVRRKGASLSPTLLAVAWDGLRGSAEGVRLATLELVAAVACATTGSTASSGGTGAAQENEERLQELAKGVGWVADRLTDGSVAVRVAAANALGRLHCVQGRLTDAQWLSLVIVPSAAAEAANGSGATAADAAASGPENAVTRKRRRREQQIASRVQQEEHAAKEARIKKNDPMNDWLMPGQSDEDDGANEGDEEEGEVAEEAEPLETMEGVGALGLALEDEVSAVRQAAVRAVRLLCCAQQTQSGSSAESGKGKGKGKGRGKGQRKGRGRGKAGAAAADDAPVWDMPLQLSRRVLVYLHDMVGDTSTAVQRSALRAVRAVLLTHQAAQPPILLSDRQLQALISPLLLDSDRQQLLQQGQRVCGTEAAGGSGDNPAMGVSLATHRLLGSAVHPSGSTISRTLRELGRAAAVADAAVTNESSQHNGNGAVPSSIQSLSFVLRQNRQAAAVMVGEVRSIFRAAAELGKQPEHAGEIHPAAMRALLGTMDSDTAAQTDSARDEGEHIDEAQESSGNGNAASSRKRRRADSSGSEQSKLIERCVAWIAVFHAAAKSPQLQSELPTQQAAAMYTTITSAAHYSGQALLPTRQELQGCEAFAAVDQAQAHQQGQGQDTGEEEQTGNTYGGEHDTHAADASNKGSHAQSVRRGEQALAGAAEHAQARIRTACLRAAEAAASAATAEAASIAALHRPMLSPDSAPTAAAAAADPSAVSAIVAEAGTVLKQARQMVSALLLPFSLQSHQQPSLLLGSVAAGRGVSQCRYTTGYAAMTEPFVQLIDCLVGRNLTGRQQGDVNAWKEANAEAEIGLHAAEELIQCSYELQHGFSFAGTAEAAVQEGEMRQVRLFAHVASLVLSSSAADCRSALRRAVNSRMPGLRDTVATIRAAAAADAAKAAAAKAAAKAAAEVEADADVEGEGGGGAASETDSGAKADADADDDDDDGAVTAWRALYDTAYDPHGQSAADVEDSASSVRERQAKAAALMAALWDAVVQLLSAPSPVAMIQQAHAEAEAEAEADAGPRLSYATLEVLPHHSASAQNDSAPAVVLSTLPWQLRLRLQLWNIPAGASLALRVALRRQQAHARQREQAPSTIVLPIATLQYQAAAEAEAAAGQDGLPPLHCQSPTAAEDSTEVEVELEDEQAERAAAAAGGGDSSSGGVAADWETSAAVILPRDLRGLYTASISLVRLFNAEVQPVHVATAPQRDTRGMVTVSTAVETVITVAR
jgi:hypothetical protein